MFLNPSAPREAEDEKLTQASPPDESPVHTSGDRKEQIAAMTSIFSGGFHVAS
jgi:hypothetical protein